MTLWARDVRVGGCEHPTLASLPLHPASPCASPRGLSCDGVLPRFCMCLAASPAVLCSLHEHGAPGNPGPSSQAVESCCLGPTPDWPVRLSLNFCLFFERRNTNGIFQILKVVDFKTLGFRMCESQIRVFQLGVTGGASPEKWKGGPYCPALLPQAPQAPAHCSLSSMCGVGMGVLF